MVRLHRLQRQESRRSYQEPPEVENPYNKIVEQLHRQEQAAKLPPTALLSAGQQQLQVLRRRVRQMHQQILRQQGKELHPKILRQQGKELHPKILWQRGNQSHLQILRQRDNHL